jgi:predicted nuclease with TOPRIM domain
LGYKVDFAHLKSEIHALERTDFAKLRQENQNLQSEIEKLSQKVGEDIGRLKAGTRLDLNLERGRLFDEYSELQTKLKEAETRIHQETDQLRAGLQQVKFDTMRTLLTTASTLGLVILGYMRLFK